MLDPNMSTDLNSIDEGQVIWASAFKNLCNVDLKGKDVSTAH